MWEPASNLRYAAWRTGPPFFFDMLARVGAEEPGVSGGPGLRAGEPERAWLPVARPRSMAVDNCRRLLGRGQAEAAKSERLSFALGVTKFFFCFFSQWDWRPGRQASEVRVSNAGGQWVKGLSGVAGSGRAARPGGWRGVPASGNFDQGATTPSCSAWSVRNRWAPLLRGVGSTGQAGRPADYLDIVVRARLPR